MKFSNKLYDILKWVCMIGLPAVATFLGVALGVFKVDPEIISGVLKILGALETLIGMLIGISTAAYNKEDDNVNEETKA